VRSFPRRHAYALLSSVSSAFFAFYGESVGAWYRRDLSTCCLYWCTAFCDNSCVHLALVSWASQIGSFTSSLFLYELAPSPFFPPMNWRKKRQTVDPRGAYILSRLISYYMRLLKFTYSNHLDDGTCKTGSTYPWEEV
jgi:hypothetical protein